MNFCKKIAACCALLLATAISFAQQGVQLKIELANTPDPKVYISVPIDGNYFEPNIITSNLNSQNTLNIDIPLKTGGIIKAANNIGSVYLIAQPNDKFELTLHPHENKITIKGNNEAGQELLNSLFVDTRTRLKELDQHAEIEKRKQLCDSLRQADLLKFKSLSTAGKINNFFYDNIKVEIDMYYRLLLSTDMFFALRKWVFDDDRLLDPADESFVKAWEAIYKDINTNKDWQKTRHYELLLARYYSLLRLQHRDTSKEKSYALAMINSFRPRLVGSALEYAWASSIAVGLKNNENEKFWLSNWDEFKGKFPESKLIAPLTPGIKNVEAYHQSLASGTKEEVAFLENYTNINSLAELGAKLKGQVSYVDLWATWCGPCKQELQYSIKLHDDLKKLGVEPVYVSLDKDNANAKWVEMVNGYPLKGTNLRASAALHADIRAKVPNFYGIPHYLIFNKQGEVVIWNAKRPSDMKILLKQLKAVN